MADGKMEEDGDGFWMKCMVVKIKQTDPDNYFYEKGKHQPTKRQAMMRDPRAYLGTGESKFEQLNFMREHAVDYRWESGWGANQALIRQAQEGARNRGEPEMDRDALYDFFKHEIVYLMVKLPTARAIEYRMRFVGNGS